MDITKKISISTVTPVYAGANYIELLIAELESLRDTWINEDAPVILNESIFVDDGSIDDSSRILDKIAERYDWIHVIHLSRNFGQHPATIAGILYSSSEWIVTLDEDLQHHPKNIKYLFESVVYGGYDVVYAHPGATVHGQWYRDFGSRGFKTVMTRLSGNRFIKFFNSFRLIRGSVARAAASVCSHDMYFDIVLSWFTQRIGTAGMELKDKRVLDSNSGYSFFKLLSHARRMAVSAHTKLFRAGALLGIIAIAVATIYGSVVFAQKIFAPESIGDVRGWASLFLSIFLFGGIISFLVTVILEYLFVILLHVQGKPTFFVIDRRKDILLGDYFRR